MRDGDNRPQVQRARLIELNLDLVDKAILVIRSAIARGTRWEDIAAMVQEYKCAARSLAGGAARLLAGGAGRRQRGTMLLLAAGAAQAAWRHSCLGDCRAEPGS